MTPQEVVKFRSDVLLTEGLNWHSAISVPLEAWCHFYNTCFCWNEI